jgi:hypothetical protein
MLLRLNSIKLAAGLSSRRLLALAFGTLLPVFFQGTLLQAGPANIYVSQNGAGSANGADAADAYPLSWLNANSSWGSGASQIGPGTTVHLVGTLTSGFLVQNSGTASAPISIYFEPNAIMSSPAWSMAPGYCAIFGGNNSNIIIDGGVNGIIQATGCGDPPLASPYGCNGIVFYSANNLIIRNVTIQNLFVRKAWSTNTIGGGSGILMALNGGPGPNNNLLITNCTVHDAAIGISIVYVSGCSNFTIAGCTVSNCNWGGNAGDANSSSVLNGLYVVNNKFTSFANWDDLGDNYHHNGFYAWGQSGGTITNAVFSGNYVNGSYGSHTTGGLFASGTISEICFYNNIISDSADATVPANEFMTLGLVPYGATAPWVGVFNNTFIGSNDGAGERGVGISGTSGAVPYPIYAVTNNLFVNVNSPVIVNYYQNAVYNFDYNDYYNPAVPFSANSGAVLWPVWQIGQDQHGSINNPNLNSSFMPVAPSAAIGAGANLSSFAGATSYLLADRNFAARPPGTNGWDIGAVQHSGIPVVGGLRWTNSTFGTP